MITKVKGTQDFLDVTLFYFIIQHAAKQAERYQFKEIVLPILEHTDLFQRSLGTETDVVNKEMFYIKTREEDEGICLRPEATASIARSFIEHGIDQLPWRVFTYGPMFRYERPQKGRYRQFNQISFEIIGAPSILHDVELIAMLDRLFHERLGINSYALLINFLGCAEDRKSYKELLYTYLKKNHFEELCPQCKERLEKNVMRVFDCKNEQCQLVFRKAPKITDHLCTPCSTEWEQLKEQLDFLSISYSHKDTLVRGLDYYSKTVFEFVSSNLGAQNAFCAGGRYDHLVAMLGGKTDQPAVGAALGIERLMLILEQMKDTLQLPQQKAVHVIIPIAKEQQSLALLVADELRAHDIGVEVLLDGSLKSMMRKANKVGAANALLIGSQEQQDKTITVKNMVTGVEEKVTQANLVTYLKK
ncbi:MAG: histidine--tRNA ligase [Candidatus Dependentiae bacterium]|nr:histidine--tRNA ligase [Candidatus Dependentiae bacterium]